MIYNPSAARVCYSPEICELSGVINHKTEDFISIIKTAFSIFYIISVIIMVT